MIIYIRFTTKDTSSKYITCTLVVSKLSVLKPYKYMSLSNILKPYIFYLSSDCETFFNIWKHKSINSLAQGLEIKKNAFRNFHFF